MEKALNYIDIFAGCGGLSTGLFNAGWHGLFAVEKNADAFSTLKFNLIDTVPHFVWPEWLSMEAHDINELSRLIISHLTWQNLKTPMMEVISNDRNTKQSHSMLKLRPSKF